MLYGTTWSNWPVINSNDDWKLKGVITAVAWPTQPTVKSQQLSSTTNSLLTKKGVLMIESRNRVRLWYWKQMSLLKYQRNSSRRSMHLNNVLVILRVTAKVITEVLGKGKGCSYQGGCGVSRHIGCHFIQLVYVLGFKQGEDSKKQISKPSWNHDVWYTGDQVQ